MIEFETSRITQADSEDGPMNALSVLGSLASLFVYASLCGIISGCGGIPKDALAMHPQTVEQRSMQTREFHTRDEKAILTACAGLLQDLGFSIDSSETSVGFVLGSKERDAKEAGQVIGATVIAGLIGGPAIYDESQKMRASVVTRPTKGRVNVRVTFQRVVWNNYGQVSRLEALDDPEMYEEFFDKLSKAVFLEAHEI